MNNSTAIGYAILAAKRWLKLDAETVRKLERAMCEAMDWHSEEEAEEAYRKS